MSLEEIISEQLEDRSFATEEEMLEEVARICDSMIEDIARYQRRFEDAPRRNAEDLDIDVDEYENEDEDDE